MAVLGAIFLCQILAPKYIAAAELKKWNIPLRGSYFEKKTRFATVSEPRVLDSFSQDELKHEQVDNDYHHVHGRYLQSCSEDDTFFVIMSCRNVCGVRNLEFKAEVFSGLCEFVSNDSNALNSAQALGCPSVGSSFNCARKGFGYKTIENEINNGNLDVMCDFCKPPTRRPTLSVSLYLFLDFLFSAYEI